jgi:paraquat-inducible protein B
MDLASALTELAGAARSIRVFADYLERHPEALLRGKAGVPQ